MNNNYNNQGMNNNYNNQNMNSNQFVPNDMAQNNMPQNNMPQNNQGNFTGLTPEMANNQPQMPVQNQTTYVNNEVDKNEVYAIIEKNLPKLMKGNGSKTSSFVFLIIGGFFLLLGLVLFFVMDEDIKTLFLVLGIIMGVIFIPIGLFKLIKAGKYPQVDFNVIKQELYGTDCQFYKDVEIFFTRNHVVKYGSGKFVFPYQEIAMAYMQEHPQTTTTVNTGGLAGALITGAIAATQTAVQMANGTQDIVIKTRSGVKEVFFAHKRENEILSILHEKNPNIMIGNTKENREAYKEVKQETEAMNQNMQQNNNQPVQAMNMGMNPLPPQNNNPQPMNNPNMNRGPMPQQPMNQNYNRGPMPNNGMPQPGPMQPQPPKNGMYQRPAGGQPRSYSSNINDQQIFNRF